MSKRYVVKLDKNERAELSQLVKQDKVAAKKRTHAQVLLLADVGRQGPGWTDEAMAEACRVTVRTVENIRKRLVLEGLEAALNRKPQARLSRAKILDGEKEAKVIALSPANAWPAASRQTNAHHRNRRLATATQQQASQNRLAIHRHRRAD